MPKLFAAAEGINRNALCFLKQAWRPPSKKGGAPIFIASSKKIKISFAYEKT